MMRNEILFGLISGLIFLSSCNYSDDKIVNVIGREPVISPDYSGVTIPYNIAPLNFRILEPGRLFHISVTNSAGEQLYTSTSDGKVHFSLKQWRQILSNSRGDKIQIEILSEDNNGKSEKYYPLNIIVAADPIDPYLCYRLLYPGYESWSEMRTIQRSLTDFSESSVVENQVLDNNCINCHTFNKNDPENLFIHVRGSRAGTYFVKGEKIRRIELRTGEMPANAVYSSWHPSGKYVAFSSNRIVQSIHMHPEKDNEFYDVSSSLVIYNLEKNEMSSCWKEDSVKYMETYPCWSPDGNFIYYCRTEQVKSGFDYREVRYDLVRRSFDSITGIFGKAQIVFDAHTLNKSASLPAVSPDGQYLVFTLHDCGSFPVWHKESDLYLLDLKNGNSERMNLNSPETESWHSWSLSGKWLVFSSKRDDGLTSRPYLAYFDTGKTGKPFILPQKDPEIYESMTETFNRPEFVTGKIKVSSRDFERASKTETLNAIWRK